MTPARQREANAAGEGDARKVHSHLLRRPIDPAKAASIEAISTRVSILIALAIATYFLAAFLRG